MTLSHVVLVVSGVVAGYINAVAGAGSLLTLPALIFSGLDPLAANATNRVGVLFQNLVTLWAYRRAGVGKGAVIWQLALPTSLGAVVGAWLATLLDGAELTRILVAVMLVFLLLTLLPLRRSAEGGPLPRMGWGLGTAFVLMGAYAGFIQAGTGVLILLYLAHVHGTGLVQGNGLKVAVNTVQTLVSLGAFVLLDQRIDLGRAVVLSLATMFGGYVGARAAIRGGQAFVKLMLVIAVLSSAVKLVWDLTHPV